MLLFLPGKRNVAVVVVVVVVVRMGVLTLCCSSSTKDGQTLFHTIVCARLPRHCSMQPRRGPRLESIHAGIIQGKNSNHYG